MKPDRKQTAWIAALALAAAFIAIAVFALAERLAENRAEPAAGEKAAVSEGAAAEDKADAPDSGGDGTKYAESRPENADTGRAPETAGTKPGSEPGQAGGAAGESGGAFRYELSGDDQVFALLMKARETDPSFRENWWTFTGEKIRLRIAFSKDADRASADAKFREIFGGHRWSLDWRSDREAELTFELVKDKTPYPVQFDLSGIAARDGTELDDPQPLTIYHHAGFRYGVLDPETLEKKELFRFSQPFHAFLPSDDGTLALAQISRQDETGPSLFTLLDLQRGGNVIEAYKPGQIQYPQWVSGTSSFLYASRKDGANTVEIMNARTGMTETFWTSPHRGDSHDGLRWARPYAVPGEKRLYVMDYRSTSSGYGFSFTADLYVWDDIGDENPEVIRDFQQGRCEGAPCFPEFRVAAGGAIFYVQPVENAAEAPYFRHWYFEPDGNVRIALNPGPEFDHADFAVLPAGRDRVLLVRHNGAEQKQAYTFYLLDLREMRPEHLFDVEEWSGYSSFGQSIPLGGDVVLAGTGEKGALIDLAGRKMTRVGYEPAAQAGMLVYWAERLE